MGIVVALALAVVFLLPLAASFAGLLFEGCLNGCGAGSALELSAAFFQLLGVSLSFTIVQAILSATLAVVWGLFLTFGLSSHPSLARLQWNLQSMLSPLLFVLPGFSVAILFADFANFFSLSSQGLLWIVLAHAVLNVFTLSEIFSRSVANSLQAEGSRARDCLELYGATRWELFRYLLRPILFEPVRTHWKWVALLSFQSFTIVLMLTPKVAWVSPEILLFSTVQMGGAPWRVLILCALQLALGFLLFRGARSGTSLSGSAAVKPLFQKVFPRSLERAGLLVWGVTGLLIVFFIARSFLSLGRLETEALLEIAQAALRSGTLALLTGLVTLGVLRLMLLYGTAATRGLLKTLSAVSATLIGVAWWSLGGGLPQGLILCSLAMSLAWLPLLSRPLWDAQEALDLSLKDSLQVYGASFREQRILLDWRFLLPTVVRISTVTALLSIGDFALTSFFAGEPSTLVTLARDFARAYRFEAMGWIFFSVVALSLVILVLLRVGLTRIGIYLDSRRFHF